MLFCCPPLSLSSLAPTLQCTEYILVVIHTVHCVGSFTSQVTSTDFPLRAKDADDPFTALCLCETFCSSRDEERNKSNDNQRARIRMIGISGSMDPARFGDFCRDEICFEIECRRVAPMSAGAVRGTTGNTRKTFAR